MVRFQFPLLVALLLQPLGSGFECPLPCFCFPNLDDPSSVTIDCRGQDLRELPSPIPNTTSHLDVSNNEIQLIRAADFPAAGLPRLRFLQLQNNDLRDIEPGALRRLPNLELLTLFNNRISTLADGVFDGLTNLQILRAYNVDLEEVNPDLFADLQSIVEIDLSLNQLEVIPAFTFSGLSRLRRLTLSNNFITNLEAFAISDLPLLQYLNLANNQLQAITPLAFSQLDQIRTVSLQGNPIECGCDGVWLLVFLQQSQLVGPECVEPERLRGQRLEQLNQSLICAFPMSEIVGSPEVVVFNGTDVTLGCLLSGAPPPLASWSRDGMTLDLSDGRITIDGPMLLISNAQVEDSGMYFCTAVSTAGEVSSVARVTVINRQLEDNVTVDNIVGADVLLECSPALPPGIEVMWELNNVSLVPSAKYLFLRNGSLVVMETDLEDMGDYVCVVDAVSLTRTLRLVAAPVITDFPEGPCTEPTLFVLDDTDDEEFPCTAFGVPAPTVEWRCEAENCFREVITEPPATTEAGSTTAMVNFFLADPEQSGTYTCTATNEHGSVSRNITVQVREISTFVDIVIEQLTFVGETAVLLCDPDRNFTEPGTMFSWQRSDGLDLPSDRSTFLAGNSTLIITDLISPDDIAEYECAVVEPDGGTTTLTYGVSIFEIPNINAMTCPVPVVMVLINETVTLECNARGNPPVMILWFVNGTSINDVIPSNRITFRNDSMLLDISALEQSDSGGYSCVASNSEGNTSYTQQLVVQVLPFFSSTPENVVVTAGELAQLRCAAGGDPPPSVHWFRRPAGEITDQPISSTDDGRLLVSDKALVVVAALPTDQGEYFCNISSPLGSRMSDTAFLRVYDPPSIPPLPMVYVATLGRMNLSFDCFGTGDPLPSVNWTMGPTQLPLPGRHVQFPNGTLLLLEVGEEDAGDYSCQLANLGGADFLDVQLIVDSFPDTMVQPEAIRTNVGCDVTFFCSDGGLPPEDAEFEWSFNDDAIVPGVTGNNFEILDTGELIISDLSVTDSGNYTCTIWGVPGNVAGTAMLLVEDPLFFSGAPSFPPEITFVSPVGFLFRAVGQTVTLLCEADGFPEPEFAWFRDGEPQPNFRRVTFDGGALIIRELRMTDAATYTCVASNALGTDSRDFGLLVIARPQFVLRPVAMEIVESEMLRLECEATGFSPTVRWFFNDSMMEVPDCISMVDTRRCQDNDDSLLVFDVAMEDAGRYTCRASNPAGAADHTVYITVLPLLVPPNITEPLENFVVEVGDPIILDCIAEGEPPLEVMWLMDGLPIATVVNDTVVIANATEEDEGRYTCIAENVAGSAVSEVFISVEAGEEETEFIYPMFVIFPTPRWVAISSLVVVDCTADGVSPPNITWQLGFEPLNETENVMVLDNGTLVIFEATVNDTGFYTCQASNEAGFNRVNIQIDVGVELFVGSGDGEIEEEEAPLLTAFPSGLLTLLPRERAILNCTALGSPSPQLTWLRDREPLVFGTDSHLRLLENGSLVILSASVHEEGLYTCQVTNRAGSAEAHIRIEVKGGSVVGTVELPEFTVLPHNMTLLTGSRIMLDCQATGSPEPYIIWMNGSRPVYESRNAKVMENGTLMMTDVKERDSGQYTCRAASSAGVREVSVEILVQAREEPPYFTVQPRGVVQLQGAYFMLHCTAMSAAGGTVNIEWSFRGQAVGGRERIEVLSSHDLLVTMTSPEDSGQYTCTARDEFGVSSTSAFVRILRSPVNSTSQALLSSTVMLQCEGGEGGVTWMKDEGVLPDSAVVFGGTLWIFGVALSDEGEYSCLGAHGAANYLLQVHVAARIVHKSTVVFAEAGHTAAMHCAPEGRPYPTLSWQRGEVRLERDNTHSVLNNGTLLIYSVAEQDSGVYVCTVGNDAGSTVARVLLQVVDKTIL